MKAVPCTLSRLPRRPPCNANGDPAFAPGIADIQPTGAESFSISSVLAVTQRRCLPLNSVPRLPHAPRAPALRLGTRATHRLFKNALTMLRADRW